MSKAKFGHCDRCDEDSVKVKVYTRKRDGARIRAWICQNKGHGLIETQRIESEVLNVSRRN